MVRFLVIVKDSPATGLRGRGAVTARRDWDRTFEGSSYVYAVQMW